MNHSNSAFFCNPERSEGSLPQAKLLTLAKNPDLHSTFTLARDAERSSFLLGRPNSSTAKMKAMAEAIKSIRLTEQVKAAG